MRTVCVLLLALLLPPESRSDVAARRPLDLSELRLPSGFQITIYAQGLGNARMLAFNPNGILFVSDLWGGRIRAIPAAGRVETFASGLNFPHGLAFRGSDLYVAENHRIVVFRNAGNPSLQAGAPEMVAGLPADTQDHITRTIVWTSDGKLIATAGSTCNLCDQPDPRLAAALRFNSDGSGMEIFARGLRNAVGIAVHPVTDDVWATNNGVDGLGDDIPPEQIYILRAGADYGWPHCYGPGQPLPGFTGSCSSVQASELNIQAHSAPLGIGFYTGGMFPAMYRNDAFVALHGSWNRATPTGYKVVRVIASSGHATGVEDFLSGFLQGSTTSGRPVHAITGPDGGLYVSDDMNGIVYRISYSGSPGNPSALNVSPSSLSFSFQIGSAAPLSQTVALNATGATALSFGASATTTSGGSWLLVGSGAGTTPATLNVSVNPAGLAAGPYTGSIMVTAPGASNSPQTIPVTLTVSTPPPVISGNLAISHLADGAGWKTSMILLNTGDAPANFTIKFWDESGNAWRLSLGQDGIQTQLTDTIPVGGSRTIQTDGIANALSVGWAEIVTSSLIGGTAIFVAQAPGQPDSEAAVPIRSSGGRRFLFPFDNSAGAATGVAVANPSATQSATVSVVLRDPFGQQTGIAGPYNIPAHGHISFVIPSSAGARGVAEFTSPGVDVIGLAIRGHGRAFTSMETQADVPAGGKTIAHLADGAGWKTTIILVNADSQPAAFTIRFRQDNGAALPLSLAADGRLSELSGTIAPGGSRTIQTDGTAATLVTGWAELATSFAVGGTAIFGAQLFGQPDSEAAVPFVAAGGRRLLVPFDGSPGFATGVAFANPNANQNANIQVVFRDVSGQQIGSAATYFAPANGHVSVVLPVSGRGVAEIASPDAPISALGIRSHNGAFTSVRALVTGP